MLKSSLQGRNIREIMSCSIPTLTIPPRHPGVQQNFCAQMPGGRENFSWRMPGGKLTVKCLGAGNISVQMPRGVPGGWSGQELNERLESVPYQFQNKS